MTTTTGATDSSNFFSTLPLYDTTSWGGELLEKYGHDKHLLSLLDACQHDDWYRPSHPYIPESSWWHQHARIIREQLLRDDKLLSHPNRNSVLRSLAIDYMKDIRWDLHRSFRLKGPCIVRDSLPTNNSHQHFDAILFSVLCIELCSYGIQQEYSVAVELCHLASACYKLAEPTYSHARELNSSTFANTAILSAADAGRYFHRFLTQQGAAITQAKKEQYEKSVHGDEAAKIKREREQQLRLARAKKASDELWYNFNRREKAATTIQLWQRRTLMRQRLQQRTKLRTLCRGASAHAAHVKASHPPIPISKSVPLHQPSSTHPVHNRPPSKHPFRHRGLSLPKRKRRQRNRRPRNRPPRYVRRAQVLPSSMPSPVPSNKSQGTVDSVPPKSPTEDHLGLPLILSWPTESTPLYQAPVPLTTVSPPSATSIKSSGVTSSTSNKGENTTAPYDDDDRVFADKKDVQDILKQHREERSFFNIATRKCLNNDCPCRDRYGNGTWLYHCQECGLLCVAREGYTGLCLVCHKHILRERGVKGY